jgi:hypothetical protein
MARNTKTEKGSVFEARVKVIRAKDPRIAMPITLWLPESFGFKEGEKVDIKLPVTLREVLE